MLSIYGWCCNALSPRPSISQLKTGFCYLFLYKMAKKQPTKQLRCKICFTSANSASHLGKHCLETGHQADQCCQRCVRWFCRRTALEEHNLSKHNESEVAILLHHVEPKNSHTTAPSQVSEQYRFTDQNYKPFALLDLDVIHSRLVGKCHSSERLKREGFIVPNNLNEINITKKQSEIIGNTIGAPVPTSLYSKRKAIVLDCEMAGTRNGASEVVSICVVDLFSGEVLMNSLVKPREQIIDWRSNIHGIRPATLSTAVVQGQALDGWEAAREKLFNHVNTDTVMVGQSIQHDLKALRISHATVVDTAILTSDAVFGAEMHSRRCWGLQSLCDDLLGLRIRQSKTHDALEDTMAAREVTLWCICYPKELQKWAKKAKAVWDAAQLQKAKRVKNRRKKATKAKPSTFSYGNDKEDFFGYNDGVLRWEDVVDREVWPKSPSSSD
ncbi:Heavy metal tolerance protein [Fusarium oxysporum f. sp. albedinis]|nr:Heavy metal tolerance protein [Fusarium oxysporum f. sp. albedinis]